MLLYTTIKKRRSRAFKQKKVYQNRTIIKEVISKNVIFLLTLGSRPRGLDGSGPPWGWTGPDPPGIGQVRTPLGLDRSRPPLGLDRSGPPWCWTGPDPPGVGQVWTPWVRTPGTKLNFEIRATFVEFTRTYFSSLVLLKKQI